MKIPTGFALGLTAAFAISALNISTATAADESVPTAIVKFDARRLATEDGTREIYRRLEAAARRVCPDADLRDFGEAAAVESCRAQALARAVQQIHSTRLVEMNDSRARRG